MKPVQLKKYNTPVSRAALLIFFITLVFNSIFQFHFFPQKVVFTKYQVAAQQYLEGKIPESRLLDYSPLYLYLNIFARKCAENPYHFILWIQIILISFSVVFLFLLLKLFFNWKLSLLGTAAFLTNKSIILYAGTFEPEPLIIFFILGFVYFSTRTLVLDGKTNPASNQLFNIKTVIFFSGLFFGLSILTRSNFFPLIVLIPFFFFITFRDIKKSLRYFMIFAIPFLVIFAFISIRNSIISHTFTLFQMNPGQVVFEGNNPTSWGESAIYPALVNEYALQFKTQSDFQHATYRYFARKIKNKPLSHNQINWFWTKKGLNFILDYPIHFFKRLLVKINFIFHEYRRHDLNNVMQEDRMLSKKFPIAPIPFALISAMAIFGMLFSAKKYKDRVFIYAVLLLQIALMAVLYTSDRQRSVIVSMFVFFAVDFLHHMLSNKKNLWLGLLVLLIAPMLFFENQLTKEEKYLWKSLSQANHTMTQAYRERKNGNLPNAIQKNALANAYAPWLIKGAKLSGLPCREKDINELSLRLALLNPEKNPSSLFDRGVLFLENNRLTEAEQIFTLLAEEKYNFNRQYNQSSLPEFYLAKINELKGDKSTAISYLHQALKRNPGDPWVLAHLSALTGETDYKEKLTRYFDEIDVQFYLGKALLQVGKFQDAIQCFLYVKEQLPGYRKVLIYLTIAQGEAGEYQKAAENYQAALSISKDPIYFEEKILTIFKKYAAQNPENPETKKFLEMILN